MWLHVIRHVANIWAWRQAMRARLCAAFFDSFHSGAVGFAILCSQRWILVNINASMVAFIEIWGYCPCLFCMFGMLIVGNQLYFDCICWLVPVATDSSVFIRSKFYCLESVEKYSEGKIHKTTLFIREILELVARRLFTINEHAIANVSLEY